jgi:hypothetical protein
VGVTPSDGIERPRVPITTVPYAFKAGAADTLGGRRPEDFVSVQQLAGLLGNTNGTPLVLSAGADNNDSSSGRVTGAVSLPLNVDFLHGFPDSAFAKLRVMNTFQQTQNFGGGVRLTATVPDTGQPDFMDSAPLDFEASILQPTSGTYTQEIFRWVLQPTIASSGASAAQLALLYGNDSVPPQPTGLSVNSDGTINFAPNQVLPSSAVMQAITTSGNGSLTGSANGSNGSPTVNTAPYEWTETPIGTGIKAGPNTITLAPCPKGLNGTDLWHFLYIATTGTPEAVLITGGSCVSKAKSGTIEFTAQYAHPAGYSIASATDGAQEAIIEAASPNNSQLARNVQIDPGSHLFHARLSVRASNLTISNSAATITCAMNDTCIMLGDPTNSNAFQNITVTGLQMIAGVPSGNWPAVEDNAMTSVISHLAPAGTSVAGASFGSLVQVDNDQAATISGLTTIPTSWSRCDTSFCSTAIVGPGGENNAGVLWVQDSNLSLGCTANGIDNQDGNTLHISNTVVEAYPQFGVRSTSSYNDKPSVQADSLYEEIGNCVNPRGTGMAGLIAEGGSASAYGSTPDGELPVFTNTGTTQYNYSIVAHSSVMGTSPAYLAGYAYTSGVGAIPVTWEKIGNTGVVTYDLLRTTGASATAPFGTGAFAVAMGIPAGNCVNGLCSLVDDAASQPSSYTVSSNTPYWPSQKMWPGSVILTTEFDYQNTGGGVPTFYFTDNLFTGAGIINSAGGFEPSVFAQVCNPQTPMSSIWIQCLGGTSLSNDSPAVTGTVLQLSGNGDNAGGLKGRTIYEMPPNSSVGATEVVTLADSNPTKTMATPNNRPTWDPNDTYIGYDQPSGLDVNHVQLAFGAPVAISSYVGNTPNNVDWGERLTKLAKTFQVPIYAASSVTVEGDLHLNGSCLGGGCGPFSPSGTQVSDTFQQANGALGPNWTVTAGTWSTANNQATFVGDGGGDDSALAVYTGSSFSGNQSATAQVILNSGGTTAAGVGVRMSASAQTGYVCFASAGLTTILKYDSGARSGLGVEGPGFRSGDYLTAQATGNPAIISCLDNGVPIAGLTATDSSSPLTSGYPGIFGEYGYSSFLDNFSAKNQAYTTNSTITFGAGVQTVPQPFSAVSPCSSTSEGTTQALVDSNTKSWGAPITGGNGTYHVLAYCDGNNWIVGIAAQ